MTSLLYVCSKFSPPDMSEFELRSVFGTECHFYNDFSVAGGGLVRPEAVYVGFRKPCCRGSQVCAAIPLINYSYVLSSH